MPRPESSYETDTRQAYQDVERARLYKRRIEGFNYTGIAMRRQLACVAAAARKIGLGRSDLVFDVPCGSGILAPTVRGTGAEMVLSDISRIMLDLAGDAYRGARVRGLVRADVTDLPLADGVFSCSICLGLMHRVPAEIRRAAMLELARVTSGHLIVSFSAFDRAQAVKRAVIRLIRPDFQFASHPTTMDELRREFADMGMRLVRIYRPIPFVSSEVVALLDVG